MADDAALDALVAKLRTFPKFGRFNNDARWLNLGGNEPICAEAAAAITELREDNAALVERCNNISDDAESECREAHAEADALRTRAPVSARSFDQIGADRLADEVAALVVRKVIDSRSAAADALLYYRNPPRTPRSDRIAELEAERDAAQAALRELVACMDLVERAATLSAMRPQPLAAREAADEYNRRQPLAWAAARAALAGRDNDGVMG